MKLYKSKPLSYLFVLSSNQGLLRIRVRKELEQTTDPIFITKVDQVVRHTIKNAYPLPLISELLDKLKGARRFTKLDVRWGYNNIQIREGDQWKAAFKTNKGLYEPTVMFFGMCNSLATFQSMMDAIFSDMIDDNLVIIYMDDILIFDPC